MSSLPPDSIRVMRQTARRAADPVAAIAQRWDELLDQAEQVAHLAQLAPEAPTSNSASFAEVLAAAHSWQRDLVWQSIDDIDAIMQPGLTALRVITARGQDAAAPALALWREFSVARAGILDILAGEHG